MSTFLYRGFDPEGRRTAGGGSFASKERMEEYLREKNVSGYEIFDSLTDYSKSGFKLVSAKELAIFSRQMSVLFVSAITLMEGAALMAEQSENRQLKICLNEMYAHMEKGLTFAEAMSMYDHIFGSYLVNMVIIGEESGSLDDVFMKMADYFEKEASIRKKLKAAVAYPAVLTVLMAGIVLLLIVKILPMFNEILSGMGGEMPAVTAMFLAFSVFVNKYLLYIVIVAAAVILGAVYFKGTERGALWWDTMKVKAPGGRYVNARVATSRFARSMAILLKSGVQLLNALEDITPLLDNRYLEARFRQVIDEVKTGGQLSTALEKMGVFPPLFLKMIVIGQSTGHLDDMMDRSANIFDEEVYDAIERITGMIEPVLIIILSIIVGVILLSVILPMNNIMNTIG